MPMRRRPEDLLQWCSRRLLNGPVTREERLLAEVFRAAADAWPIGALKSPRDPRDRRLVYSVIGLARWFEAMEGQPEVDEQLLAELHAFDPWQRPARQRPRREVREELLAQLRDDRDRYEREDPVTGDPLPDGVEGFRPGGDGRW